MGVEVVDVKEEVSTAHIGGVVDNCEDELNRSRKATVSETSTAQSENGLPDPCVGMEFNSEFEAKNFYDDYAKRAGFNTRVGHFNRSSGSPAVREFFCASGGVKGKVNGNCRAMVRVECESNGKWAVTKFVKDHNHSSRSSNKVHYLKPRRHFAGATKPVIETYQRDIPSALMYVSVDGSTVPPGSNIGVKTSHPVDTNHNSKNYGLKWCKRTLGRDAQNLLDYFKKMQAENPGFYYAIQLDEENRMSNAFWSDSRSRTAYSHFGDAVIFDTIYRVNRYTVPFAPFTGVNHHGQTILFACALLLDESETSFVWLFKTFIACMHDRTPVSITTDEDKVIEAAVSKVLPGTRHYISRWHVLREGQIKMAPVCQVHPNFEMELYNCINLTKTIEEFESSWNYILEKYDLHRNDWLQSVYNSRKQWVPVYFRDSFFAAISPDQGFQSCFFNGYVDQQTTLPMFFRQYELALDQSFEKELEADFDTISTTPILRTPSPMEKQAAGQYTRRIFSKFQEELVETFVYTANKIDDDGSTSTFRVAKFEDDQKAYIVSLNVLEMKANCSCQMFEYCGILCRHVLTVFTVTNILTLPSHYILKRWTTNAKYVAGSFEEPGQLHGNKSPIMRYNHLCREAIRCVEEGAIAPEAYDVALNALREVGKKLAAAKKSAAKAPTTSPLGNVIKFDDQTLTSASDVTPLLWSQQDEMSRLFNLNDNGAPARLVSDLNLPRTLPACLHHHDGHSDSMGTLPCLKSMTWAMEHKSSTPANRVALITLKLQDSSKTPSGESDVKFHLSQTTLEPMLRSMAYISEQLSVPANKVAVINLKLQDAAPSSGESDIKFQVSRDTLGAMLRSMAYIREQLSNAVESRSELPSKKQKT